MNTACGPIPAFASLTALLRCSETPPAVAIQRSFPSSSRSRMMSLTSPGVFAVVIRPPGRPPLITPTPPSSSP
ncbi:MAG: hypothetical protein IPI34_08720 [bacterium]|nr:hypothetical protein [bacterium]